MAHSVSRIVHKSWVSNTNADALSRMGNINAIEGQTDTPDEKTRRQILYSFTIPLWEVTGG